MQVATIFLILAFFGLQSCGGSNGEQAPATTTESSTDDPLFTRQWHLLNNGQLGGTVGEDCNVTPVWATGNKGDDVLVVVVDNGLQIAHHDLAANILAGQSYNYVDLSTDPSGADADHGTSVAGLI